MKKVGLQIENALHFLSCNPNFIFIESQAFYKNKGNLKSPDKTLSKDFLNKILKNYYNN